MSITSALDDECFDIAKLCSINSRSYSLSTSLSQLKECQTDLTLVCRGHSFFTTNEELLDRYAECPGSAEVIAVQTSYLESLHAAPRPVPGAGASLLIHLLQTIITLYGLEKPSAASVGHSHDVLYIFRGCWHNVCDLCV